jgi:subtilisin-like proprotein convertase family protein
VILAANADNNGSKNIIAPSSLTDSGRLMIKAVDNVFLDVNNATIIIKEATIPTFFLTANEFSKTGCGNDNEATFQFEYTPSSLFTETVTFTAIGQPSAATVIFTPATASDSKEMITIAIEEYSDSDPQDYSITINGKSLTQEKEEVVVLTLKGTNFFEPVLTSPADGSVKQSTYPLYTWSEVSNGDAELFDIEIATDPNFTEIIETAEVSNNGHTQDMELIENTQYYWRVKPKNECGSGDFSSVSSFTTGSSACFSSVNNTPTVIGAVLTVTSTIDIATDVPITDINVSMEISHSYIGDIVVELTSPLGTTVTLISGKCGDSSDLDATFDDLGLEDIVCSSTSPAISGTLKPTEALSAFNGESTMGTWTLSVTDIELIFDDGILTSWGIDYCGVDENSLTTENFDSVHVQVYPNPTKNRLTVKFEKMQSVDVVMYDLLGRRVLTTSLEYSGKTIDVSSLSSGTYIMQLTDDENRKTSKKVIIE